MRIGSLFSGYGGLDRGVQAVWPDAELTWVSDIAPGAVKLLAHRHPDVPNLGDITAVDWSQVEPVEIITGGFPCQDLSSAGARAGMRTGTRSGLWSEMHRAISTLRPRWVVIENVRGILSAHADSDVEPCPWCMGDDTAGTMRALGAVLADLASIGYDAQWTGLRVADLGGCHGRFRVFILAHPADADDNPAWAGREPHNPPGCTGELTQRDIGALMPTPQARDAKGVPGEGFNEGNLPKFVSPLPTPVVSNRRSNRSASAGAAIRPSLHAVDDLLPTPRATDGTKGGPNQRGSSGDLMLPSAVVQLLPTPMVGSTNPAAHGQISGDYRARMDEAFANWGDYAPTIARWEALTRPAPAPTELGTRGSPRLSPRFVEWMMGLPKGWVTDTPGLSRSEQLALLGNGVVPIQAAAALTHLLSIAELEAAA